MSEEKPIQYTHKTIYDGLSLEETFDWILRLCRESGNEGRIANAIIQYRMRRGNNERN
jgi:hypothetical protein